MTYGLKEAHDELLSELKELRAKYAEVCETSAMLRADMAAARKRQAKLRELAERAWKTAERLCQAFDGPCRADDVTAYKPCPMGEHDEECVYGQLQRELREIGVEVDG